MVDSFEFSDAEREFKRNKTAEKSYKSTRATSLPTSPRTSDNRMSNYYNTRNDYNNYNNRNRENRPPNYNNNNNRPNEYLGNKRPFKAAYQKYPNSSFRPPPPNSNYHRTSLSRNYRVEANRVLPKFGDFLPYKGRPFEAQGYRDPKYFESSKKPPGRNISKTFSKEIVAPVPVVLSPPNSLEIDNTPPSPINTNQRNDPASSYFKIKTINSYKEFCRIKVKGFLGLETIYETISFLKRITKDSSLPIFLFFDEIERVFYGAAVISLEEISEKEQIDTNTLESLIFRLNWIFLSEVEESNTNFVPQELENFSEIDPQKGFELLKLMEQCETQLHDVKKLKPVALKLKTSRLEELEDFFKLTENRENQENGNVNYNDNVNENDCDLSDIDLQDKYEEDDYMVDEDFDSDKEMTKDTSDDEPNEFITNDITNDIDDDSLACDPDTKPTDSDDDFFADYE